MIKSLKRRDVLRALGTSLSLAPFIPLLDREAEAQAGQFPVRYIQFFTPLGTWLDHWRPQGGESDFTLSQILAPLEPMKKYLTILDGVQQSSGGGMPPHEEGTACSFSANFIRSPLSDRGPAKDDPKVSGRGQSLDQYFATRLAGQTPFKQLNLGVTPNTDGRIGGDCYCSVNDWYPIPTEDDPSAAFQRLFTGLPTPIGSPTQDPAAIARKLAEEKSILDLVGADLTDLRGKVGSSEYQKIDQHLAHLRALELRLTGGTNGNAPTKEGCAAPPKGSTLDFKSFDNQPMLLKAQMDNAVAALSCDLTRSVVLQLGRGGSDATYPWLGLNNNHHGWTHSSPGDPGMVASATKFSTWCAEQLLYLLQQLASVKEGDGTLLDHTVLLWSTEVAEGESHSYNNMPYVIAGGAGGAFPSGRYLKYKNTRSNRLFVSMCHAMGFPEVEYYGDTDAGDFGKGPLPGLS